jgi:hypothetical protein
MIIRRGAEPGAYEDALLHFGPDQNNLEKHPVNSDFFSPLEQGQSPESRQSSEKMPRHHLTLTIHDLKIGEGGWVIWSAMKVGQDGKAWLNPNAIVLRDPQREAPAILAQQPSLIYVKKDEAGYLVDIRVALENGVRYMLEPGFGPFYEEKHDPMGRLFGSALGEEVHDQPVERIYY